MKGRKMSKDETAKNPIDALPRLLDEVKVARAALDAAARDYSSASIEQSRCINELRDKEELVDACMAQIKKSAPRGSSWRDNIDVQTRSA
jgi:hypothetical protein